MEASSNFPIGLFTNILAVLLANCSLTLESEDIMSQLQAI